MFTYMICYFYTRIIYNMVGAYERHAILHTFKLGNKIFTIEAQSQRDTYNNLETWETINNYDDHVCIISSEKVNRYNIYEALIECDTYDTGLVVCRTSHSDEGKRLVISITRDLQHWNEVAQISHLFLNENSLTYRIKTSNDSILLYIEERTENDVVTAYTYISDIEDIHFEQIEEEEIEPSYNFKIISANNTFYELFHDMVSMLYMLVNNHWEPVEIPQLCFNNIFHFEGKLYICGTETIDDHCRAVMYSTTNNEHWDKIDAGNYSSISVADQFDEHHYGVVMIGENDFHLRLLRNGEFVKNINIDDMNYNIFDLVGFVKNDEHRMTLIYSNGSVDCEC